MALVSDGQLEKVSFVWKPGLGITTSGPDLLRPLRALIFMAGWYGLKYASAVLRERGQYSFDDFDFQYPKLEWEWDDTPHEGVRVENPWDGYVDIEVPAFERFMLRFLRFTRDSAEARQDPVTKEPWWPEVGETIALMEARLAAEGEPLVAAPR